MKKSTKPAERNYVFDILRIIAMFMIVVHHFTVYNLGLMDKLTSDSGTISSIQATICIFINCFLILGVNLFFMLSGYFGIKYDIKKFFKFIFQIYLTYTTVTVMGILTKNVPFNSETVLNILNPFRQYWYLLAYAIIMLLAPALNKIVKALTKKDVRRLIPIVILFFTIYPMFNDQILNFGRGYSLIWGIILYLTGAFIKKYRFKLRRGWLYYALFSTANAVMICLFCHFGHKLTGWSLFAYNNPLIYAASISLFAYFASIKRKITNPKLTSIINFYASSTLMIYLLHSTCYLTMYQRKPIHLSLEYLGFTITLLLIPLYAVFIMTVHSFVSAFYNKTVAKALNIVLSNH